MVVTRDELVEFARDIVAETEANPPSLPTDLDFGTVASFWMYPKGEALSCVSEFVFNAVTISYFVMKHPWLALHAAWSQGENC